jgi:CheY-like chemotaxis protein
VVTEALSGARALDMLKLGTEVDVVLTDHAMPGMTGVELAGQVRELWPDLPVILASGYAELPNGEETGLPRLSKPYMQDELAEQIAKVVGATPSNVIALDTARRA